MAGRLANDWLTTYLKYTEKSEPPLSYHTWTAISLIAGALQRRCRLVWGFEVLYPNLYVILVGPSGRARKGVALGIGKDLLAQVKINVTSENVTREALIKAMKTGVSSYMAGGMPKFHCSVTTFSEELSVFLGQNDIKFLASLTDWYDSKDSWSYETKSGGKDHLQGVCVNLLGATAPDWLQSMLPQEAVGGGFTSRVIFVVEDKKGKSLPKPEHGDEERTLKKALLSDLEQLTLLTGDFHFDTAGEAAYTNWYMEHERAMEANKPPVDDPRFAGYCERRATHLRKLSMVISASRGDDLTITQTDFDRANKILTAAERRMNKTFGGLGSAQYGQMTEKVKDYMQKVGTTTRSQLMRMFYRDVDSTSLKIIEEVLVQMRVIKITNNLSSNEIIYTWLGEGPQ
jgi:hypothetical protein